MAETNFLFGLHAVQAAFEQDSDSVEEIWVDAKRQDKRMTTIIDSAKKSGLVVHAVDKQVLSEKAGSDKHQGVVAQCRAPGVKDEAWLARLLETLDEPPFLLILDGVQDPHNLGACLRTADGAGVHAIIAPKDRAASLTPTVIKVASGAAQTVPFIQVTNLSRTLKMLKEAGVWLVGLDGYAEQSLYETDLKGSLAIVMGAEGQGLRRLTKEHCDYLVKIPMSGSVESLNVSVAAGICLFEALRKRAEKGQSQ